MLTRCPACATVFRLDTVQLRAREGRVRCGRCHTVFDAVDAMVELPLPRSAGTGAQADSSPTAEAAPPEQSHATLSVLAAPDIEAPTPSPADLVADWPADDLPEGSTPATGEPPAPVAGESMASLVERTTGYWATLNTADGGGPAVTDTQADRPDDAPDDGDAVTIDLGAPLDEIGSARSEAPDPDITQPVPVAEMLAEINAAEALPDASAPLETDSDATASDALEPDSREPDLQEPIVAVQPAAPAEPTHEDPASNTGSLLPSPQPDPLLDTPAPLERVRDPAMQRIRRELYGDAAPAGRSLTATVLWTTGCTLLALAAVVQLIYLFRTELAVAQPALKPVLERACERLGCSVPAPRRADLISIESSELNPDAVRAPLLRLNALLRNGAAFPQAWPHLELTLTDNADRPVVRRVIAPEDYLPAANRPETFMGNSEHAISLLVDPGATSAGGYRLYVFHP